MVWNEEGNSLLVNVIAGSNGSESDAKALIPDIIRLVEDPDVKKEIALDEISIPEDSNSPSTTNTPGTRIQTGGVRYPVIRINDYVFGAVNVKKMSISCTGFLPTISVYIETIENTFANKSLPKDGDILSLFMRTTTEALSDIRCDFIITSFVSKPYKTTESLLGSAMNVSGVLFIPGFNATKPNTFAYIGTSREVLKKIAEDFHIGFAYNEEENSNDTMNWISCNQTMNTFVQEVLKHAWKDNVSFFDSWVDLYYNLVYVNINKYMNDSKNEGEFDITFYSNVISHVETNDVDYSVENATPAIKLLTNSPGFRKTPFYIKSWAPSNNSTSISFNTGYDIDVYSFLHNQNILNNSDKDAFSILNCVPSYDQSKTDTHMILRGRAKYDPKYHSSDDKEYVNYDYVNTYVKKDWYGISYMIDSDEKTFSSNDTWSGNVHQNYALAPYHNNINKNELNKLYITVECEGLNLQIQRGEYVPVLIIYENEAEYMMNNSAYDKIMGTDTEANRVYSGFYYVSDVIYNYNYNLDKESFSTFSTVFTLKRKEWPTPEKIAKD